MNLQEEEVRVDARADLLDFIRALHYAVTGGVPRRALQSALEAILIDEEDPTEASMTLRRLARAKPKR